MNNKAQVSFEYLILIGVLIIISTLVMIISQNYFSTSKSVRETGELYSNKTLEMLEVKT